MADFDRTTIVLVMATALVAVPARADLQAGKQAYQRGDYDTARVILLPLAEAGNPEAQVFVGLMHATGKGVDKDSRAAARWYREAASQGHPDAQFNLALLYGKGQGVPMNYAAAVQLYRQAAEQGHAGAQLNLGVCYARGRGVLRDEKAAAHWFRQAAEQGNPAAQFNLGLAYADGSGVAQDPTQSAAWYAKAAEQGYPPAQLNLGFCYERGFGVPKDPVIAAQWYRRAAAAGNRIAKANLERLAVELEQPAEEQIPASTALAPPAAETIAESSAAGLPAPDTAREQTIAQTQSAVGDIVTRADSLAWEVDTMVARIDDLSAAAPRPKPAGPPSAAEPQAPTTLPQTEGQLDELALAWRNRGALPSPPQENANQ